jgi:hypothetical protein
LAKKNEPSQNHHRLCRDLTGHSNDLRLSLNCVCRSDSPPDGVVLPVDDFFLEPVRLVSETDLLQKVVCHERWVYELTEDDRNRNTLFLPIQRCVVLKIFSLSLQCDFTTVTRCAKFSESGTVGCVSGTW